MCVCVACIVLRLFLLLPSLPPCAACARTAIMPRRRPNVTGATMYAKTRMKGLNLDPKVRTKRQGKDVSKAERRKMVQVKDCKCYSVDECRSQRRKGERKKRNERGRGRERTRKKKSPLPPSPSPFLFLSSLCKCHCSQVRSLFLSSADPQPLSLRKEGAASRKPPSHSRPHAPAFQSAEAEQTRLAMEAEYEALPQDKKDAMEKLAQVGHRGRAALGTAGLHRHTHPAALPPTLSRTTTTSWPKSGSSARSAVSESCSACVTIPTRRRRPPYRPRSPSMPCRAAPDPPITRPDPRMAKRPRPPPRDGRWRRRRPPPRPTRTPARRPAGGRAETRAAGPRRRPPNAPRPATGTSAASLRSTAFPACTTTASSFAYFPQSSSGCKRKREKAPTKGAGGEGHAAPCATQPGPVRPGPPLHGAAVFSLTL